MIVVQTLEFQQERLEILLPGLEPKQDRHRDEQDVRLDQLQRVEQVSAFRGEKVQVDRGEDASVGFLQRHGSMRDLLDQRSGDSLSGRLSEPVLRSHVNQVLDPVSQDLLGHGLGTDQLELRGRRWHQRGRETRSGNRSNKVPRIHPREFGRVDPIRGLDDLGQGGRVVGVGRDIGGPSCVFAFGDLDDGLDVGEEMVDELVSGLVVGGGSVELGPEVVLVGFGDADVPEGYWLISIEAREVYDDSLGIFPSRRHVFAQVNFRERLLIPRDDLPQRMLRSLVQLLASGIDAGQRAGAEAVLQLLGDDLEDIGGEVSEGGLHGKGISMTQGG